MNIWICGSTILWTYEMAAKGKKGERRPSATKNCSSGIGEDTQCQLWFTREELCPIQFEMALLFSLSLSLRRFLSLSLSVSLFVFLCLSLSLLFLEKSVPPYTNINLMIQLHQLSSLSLHCTCLPIRDEAFAGSPDSSFLPIIYRIARYDEHNER